MLKEHLIESWKFAASSPNEFSTPLELNDSLNWQAISAPVTVAQANKELSSSTSANLENLDDFDWWFQADFSVDKTDYFLLLEGLATIADVWLNGKLVLKSDNMFVAHKLDVEAHLKHENQIIICFRSLGQQLSVRRARPRWKTKLVNQQNLRWFRTTLLGRIPGWTPPTTAVGPWLPVKLVPKSKPLKEKLLASIKDELATLEVIYSFSSDAKVTSASLLFDNQSYPLQITSKGKGEFQISEKLEFSKVNKWWPHTHGTPKLYELKLAVEIEAELHVYSIGKVGFKSLSVDQSNDNFEFKINNTEVYCRGVCWTTNDIVSLTGKSEKLKESLTLLKDAGVNMIRIGGTMVYEQELFYQICDELGLLVWQDFMFANMDYPFEDEDFLKNVSLEAKQQLSRLSSHACIAAYCGNSEVSQQVSMLGMGSELAEDRFYTDTLANLCEEIHPGAYYLPTTPFGGAMPFHLDSGVSHYFGVGAYQRPLSELRSHNVKFASESLGFSNIPVTSTRHKVTNGETVTIHDPRWKKGTPRDSGSSWDFEDVRDHYLEQRYGVSSAKLKYEDNDTYFRLSELVTGEMMSDVFSEWRSSKSTNSGGLIWFAKDLSPGAGWGIIDSLNKPKACYFYLKRSWQPVNLSLTNETLKGVNVHISNEKNTPLKGRLKVTVFNKHSVPIAELENPIELLERENKTLVLDELFKHFYDLAYVYRFGPSKHSLIAASFWVDDKIISTDILYPNEIPWRQPVEKPVEISATENEDKSIDVTIKSESFLYGVVIEAKGFDSSDNFFQIIPNLTKQIVLRPNADYKGRFRAYLSAVNLQSELTIRTK